MRLFKEIDTLNYLCFRLQGTGQSTLYLSLYCSPASLLKLLIFIGQEEEKAIWQWAEQKNPRISWNDKTKNYVVLEYLLLLVLKFNFLKTSLPTDCTQYSFPSGKNLNKHLKNVLPEKHGRNFLCANMYIYVNFSKQAAEQRSRAKLYIVALKTFFVNKSLSNGDFWLKIYWC